jgi:nitroreductase
LTPPVPDAPDFGDPIEVARPSAETLALLARRRSAPAQALAAPGPDAAQLATLLRLAARVPDHGKLFPWRFIVLEGAAKAAFAARLEPLACDQGEPDKALAVLAKLKNPPVTVAVVSRIVSDRKPVWEQQLSAGALCMNLLIAADAMGFAANWITDWYAYDERATAILGLEAGERIAGFIHLGSVAEPPLERVRPSVEALTTRWRG